MYNQLEDNWICSKIRHLLLPLNCPLTFTAILGAQFKFILKNKHIYVFFLLVLGISSHSRDFHSHRDVTITGEVLRILTCARHLSPLSSEGSLACNTYCNTEYPLFPGTCIAERLASGDVTTCFNDFGLLQLGFIHPAFRLWGERSIRLPTAAAINHLDHNKVNCYSIIGKHSLSKTNCVILFNKTIVCIDWSVLK